MELSDARFCGNQCLEFPFQMLLIYLSKGYQLGLLGLKGTMPLTEPGENAKTLSPRYQKSGGANQLKQLCQDLKSEMS